MIFGCYYNRLIIRAVKTPTIRSINPLISNSVKLISDLVDRLFFLPNLTTPFRLDCIYYNTHCVFCQHFFRIFLKFF